MPRRRSLAGTPEFHNDHALHAGRRAIEHADKAKRLAKSGLCRTALEEFMRARMLAQTAAVHLNTIDPGDRAARSIDASAEARHAVKDARVVFQTRCAIVRRR